MSSKSFTALKVFMFSLINSWLRHCWSFSFEKHRVVRCANFIYERMVLNKYLMIFAPRWLDFYCIDTYGKVESDEDLNCIWYFFLPFASRFRTKFASLFWNCRLEDFIQSVIGISRLFMCAPIVNNNCLKNCKPTIIFRTENGKQIRKVDPGETLPLLRCCLSGK